jgi:hypothetical protein
MKEGGGSGLLTVPHSRREKEGPDRTSGRRQLAGKDPRLAVTGERRPRRTARARARSDRGGRFDLIQI